MREAATISCAHRSMTRCEKVGHQFRWVPEWQSPGSPGYRGCCSQCAESPLYSYSSSSCCCSQNVMSLCCKTLLPTLALQCSTLYPTLCPNTPLCTQLCLSGQGIYAKLSKELCITQLRLKTSSSLKPSCPVRLPPSSGRIIES